MKQGFRWWRGARVGLTVMIAGVIVVLPCCAVLEESDAVHVSFEQPFEQTRIKTIVDAYMWLWSDLEALVGQREALDRSQQALAFEAAIGRATFVGWAVDQLLRHTPQNDIVGDGLQYMCHATSQMNELAAQVQTDNDHARCMHELLGRLWQRLACGVVSGRGMVTPTQ